jgi:hypothetical protein
MRILRSIVETTANLVAIGHPYFFYRCGIRAKPVGDDGLRTCGFR